MRQIVSAARQLRSPRRIFPGWRLVGVAAATQALLSGIGGNSWGLYLVALQREFGWTRASLSVAFSLGRVESALLGPVEGYLVDRFGPRRMIFIGIVLFGLGFIILSYIRSLPGFYVAFAVVSLGGGLAGFLALMTIINHWFQRLKTLAMALAQTGGSIGGLFTPVLAWAMATYGWEVTARGAGLILIVAAVPVALLLRDRPETYGLLPDGDPPDAAISQVADGRKEGSHQEFGLSLGEALRTPAFWIITFAHGCAGLAIAVGSVHFAAHLTDRGLSLQMAGTIIAAYIVTTAISQPAAGILGDRFSKPLLIAGFIALQGTGMVIAIFVTSVPTAFLFAIVFGLGLGGRGTLLTSIRGEYFGRRAFATIMGFSQLPLNVIWTASPIIAGYVFDVQHSYTWVFAVVAGLNFLGAATILLARKPKQASLQGPEAFPAH